mgnify:CR=1 FL=1
MPNGRFEPTKAPSNWSKTPDAEVDLMPMEDGCGSESHHDLLPTKVPIMPIGDVGRVI